MFDFVLLCPKRWFQINSRIVRAHFSSKMTLNNWKLVVETRSYIFRWRFRFRRRRVCSCSLLALVRQVPGVIKEVLMKFLLTCLDGLLKIVLLPLSPHSFLFLSVTLYTKSLDQAKRGDLKKKSSMVKLNKSEVTVTSHVFPLIPYTGERWS